MAYKDRKNINLELITSRVGERRCLVHAGSYCPRQPHSGVPERHQKTADFFDKSNLFKQGRLALEHFTPETRVDFKKIEIKELPPEEPDWVKLFNGKDLTGWETFEKGTGRWKVVDGNLTCDGPCSYLFTRRDDYKDFHFRVEARLNAKGNSGQYFRSRFEPGQPKGYYAQINSDPAFTRTGSLNRVTLSGGFERLVNVPGGLVLDDAWFTQEVIAIGNHIQILVNGKKVVDYIDKDSVMYKQGRLALEHMTEATRIEFRKVEIKELPPEEPAWIKLFNGKDLKSFEKQSEKKIGCSKMALWWGGADRRWLRRFALPSSLTMRASICDSKRRSTPRGFTTSNFGAPEKGGGYLASIVPAD